MLDNLLPAALQCPTSAMQGLTALLNALFHAVRPIPPFSTAFGAKLSSFFSVSYAIKLAQNY
jgi:hypothetical protein